MKALHLNYSVDSNYCGQISDDWGGPILNNILDIPKSCLVFLAIICAYVILETLQKGLWYSDSSMAVAYASSRRFQRTVISRANYFSSWQALKVNKVEQECRGPNNCCDSFTRGQALAAFTMLSDRFQMGELAHVLYAYLAADRSSSIRFVVIAFSTETK